MSPELPPSRRWVFWLACGLGAGKSPVAPGTCGSVVGLLWFCLLLWPRNPWVYGLGAVGGVFVAVWLAAEAVRYTGHPDPPAVVVDEIVAIPLCFLTWIGWRLVQVHPMPGAGYFFGPGERCFTLGVWAAFRLFDILKPWPVRQSQRLPGGWGVTVDDVLAAGYVNLVVLGALAVGVGR